MRIYDQISKTNKEIELFDIFKQGSNSNVCEMKFKNKSDIYLAKCSRSSDNYISFNLQCKSFMITKSRIKDERIVIPNIMLYGTIDEIGDILIMDKLENLFEIDFIINNELYYGELIIKLIASVIAYLHSLGISGYDVEFYWKADTNQLVVLDIGPQYTFGYSSNEMLEKHWNLELNNYMGTWNIISQIIPKEDAKRAFKNNLKGIDLDYLKKYLDDNSIKKHIENVAKVHALTFFAKLPKYKQKKYVDIFLSEYKKNITNYSFENLSYMNNIKKTIENNIKQATACLYYSNEETLCNVSCSTVIS